MRLRWVVPHGTRGPSPHQEWSSRMAASLTAALDRVRNDPLGVLDRPTIERVCDELGYTNWRGRELDPATTVHRRPLRPAGPPRQYALHGGPPLGRPAVHRLGVVPSPRPPAPCGPSDAEPARGRGGDAPTRVGSHTCGWAATARSTSTARASPCPTRRSSARRSAACRPGRRRAAA